MLAQNATDATTRSGLMQRNVAHGNATQEVEKRT
jgi:hypothetical protein